jgi:hypothetical protein
MSGRALLIVALLVVSGLAGCIAGKDQGSDGLNSTQSNMTGVVNPNETIAPDGRGQISAFNETNKTETTGIGAMVHTHDYWKGKERLDVGYINGGLIPFPLLPCKRKDGACTAGSGGDDTYPAATAIADFLFTPLSDGLKLIPEGTKTLEVKMTKFTGPEQCVDPSVPCVEGTPSNPAGQVFFDYLAANDEPGAFHKGGELTSGQPISIDLKPTDADMPHQTGSLWIFRIYSNSQMVWFDFNITLTAVKGYDVVNWPPHPDLYADKRDRSVFDAPVKLASKGTADSNLYGSDAGWIHPEKVVSWGTESVDIEITDVVFTSQTPATPSGWVFEYNNASKPPLLGHGAQYSARLTDSSSDGKTFHFNIDLKSDDGSAYDTPYAQYSRWGFRLVPRFDEGASQACVDDPFVQQFLVGCQFVPWEATYHMKIIAHGHSIANGVPQSAQ